MKTIKIIYLSLFFGSMFFYSCIKPLEDFKLTEKDPEIVLNAVLNPDTVFNVHISRSFGTLDKEELLFVPGAKVYVYENNIQSAILSEYNEGIFFDSGFRPKEGAQYKIVVEADGFATVESWVKIPDKVVVNRVDTSTVKVYDDFNYSSDQFQIKVNFENDLSEKNFYTIEVKSHRWQYSWEIDPFDPSDSNYVYEGLYLSSKDPKIELSIENSYVSSFEDYGAGEVYEKWGRTMVFTDKLLNSQLGTITVNLSNGGWDYYQDNPDDTIKVIDVIVSEISEDYFLYLKALSKYSDNPGDNFFSERVSLYSNVENGMGIVAAQTSVKHTIFIPVISPEGNIKE